LSTYDEPVVDEVLLRVSWLGDCCRSTHRDEASLLSARADGS